MPRKRRTQPGDSGGAYENRQDLAQPNTVPTGLPYGENQQLGQAQAQQPLPQQPQPQQTPMASAMAAAQAHSFQPVGLSAPSARPIEPVTHGLPTGPGAGPEALPVLQTAVSALLAQVAQESGNPNIAFLAQRAKQYGQ